MAIDLRPGDALTGLLSDGIDETPWVVGTLQADRDRGVSVEIPYLRHDEAEQFAHVDRWFRDRNPPRNLLMLTPSGLVSLFGISWGGHSDGGLSTGRLRPAEVVLHGRDGELEDALMVRTLRSELDGLNEWAQASAIDTDYAVDSGNRVTGMTVKVRSSP